MKSLILTAQDARDLEKVGGLTITKPIKPTPRYIENASLRPAEGAPGDWYIVDENGKRLGAESGLADIFAPPVQIGDAVFIREPWYRLRDPSGGESDRYTLAADSGVSEDQVAYKWSSPVSMPEAAARRFVRVVSVAPLYNESVAVWEIELEKITKEAALAAEADEPPIVSEADDPENVSDYLTYTGDMSPEDHERMIAKIDADRAHLSEVRERLARIDERLGEISRLMFEDRGKVDANDRAAVEAENETLQEEQAQLSSEEAELVEALTAAGVPVDEIETPEEAETTEEPVEGATATESAGDAPEDDEEIGSFTFGKCKYCGREWGVTLEGAKGGGYPTQRTADAAATRLCTCPEAVEKRKPIVGVAVAVMRGACRFCGQYIEVGPHASKEEADETASAVCSCIDARRARRITEQIEDAKEKINRVFGEEAEKLGFKPINSPGSIQLLEEIASLIAIGEITAAAVNIRGQCKAKLTFTSKEKIKVSRSETRSYDLEAGK